MTTTVEIKSAGGVLQSQLAALLNAIRAELLAEAGAYLRAENARVSPVGDPPIDTHPGKLMASWLATVGSPAAAGLADAPSYPRASGDRMEFIPPLRGSQPGQAVHITNDAQTDAEPSPYAYEIAVLGESRKAPEGTVAPSLAALEGDWPEVAAAAIAEALSREGGS